MTTGARGIALGCALLLSAGAAHAGCVGAVVNGKCYGNDVQWDTHEPGKQHPDPPGEFYWDWRGTNEQQRHPETINPNTGRDPNDSHWGDPDRGAVGGIPNIRLYDPHDNE